MEKDKTKWAAFIFFIFIVFTLQYSNYVLSSSYKDIGATVTLKTGDKITVIAQDGNKYQLSILDISLSLNAVLVEVKYPDGATSMKTFSKNSSVSVGPMTWIVKSTYVGIDGAIHASFNVYGVSVIGNYCGLKISSIPSGAKVYVNDISVGITPLLYYVPPGEYSLKVKYEGYPDYLKKITILQGETEKIIQVKFGSVEAVPNRSLVNITSNPMGAKIFLNSTYLGETPIVNYNVSPGIYTLRAYLNGFIPYVATINLKPGSDNNISIALKSETGVLRVKSIPPGANVYINGNYSGRTPLDLILPVGNYTITISKSNYMAYTSSISIKGNNTTLIEAQLKPGWGTLKINSTVNGLKVFIDSKYIGDTPVNDYNLSPGLHEISILFENISIYSTNKTIIPGETTIVQLKDKDIYGTLKIISNVNNSVVYIDGTPKGRVPIYNLKVLPGEHLIVVKATGFKSFVKRITVRPKDSKEVMASLIPLTLPNTSTVPVYSTSRLDEVVTTKLPPSNSMNYMIFGIITFLGLFGTILKLKRSGHYANVEGFPKALIKKYYPIRFLGEGGFAKVFKVKRKSDGKVIALKVFPPGEKAKKFFTKEVKAWKLLNHPNIVKLHNAFEGPIPHLELEFVYGYTLNGKLIRDLEHYPKPVNEELALKFIEGIARGLDHAHSKQVYHRDLKPSNILLTDNLTPKITDFGLAKVGSKSTTTTTKALTPLYAAPEQIDEKTYGHTDHRTDIYQLGVILYELLTGKLPYEGLSTAVVLAKITNPDVKPKPPSAHNLSLAKYDRMFEKLLAKNKEDRYQSLEEFLNDFDKLVDLMGKRDALKNSLEITKETLSKTSDEFQLEKLNSELVGLLIQNAILSAKINDKEEVLNALYDLMPFTKKNRNALKEAIRNVQLFIQDGLPIPDDFVDTLKILLHQIEKENS